MEWLVLFGELKELAQAVAPWIVSGGGVILITNFLKTRLDIPDRPWLLGFNARAWLAAAVSLALGLIVGLAEGYYDPSQLALENLAETIVATWSVATALYFKVAGGGSGDNNRGVF